MSFSFFKRIMPITLVLVLYIFINVSIASAAPLETTPNTGGHIVSCTGVSSENGGIPCNWCTFVQMIGHMVQYSIYLSVMLSALMFSYAGFLFLTNNGSSENIKKAWNILRRSLLGTVAILAAWLIVNAIMTKLAVGLNLGNSWNSITGCSELTIPTNNTVDIGDNRNVNVNINYPTDRYNDLTNEIDDYLVNGNNGVRTTLVSDNNVYPGIARATLKSSGIAINKTCTNGTCVDKLKIRTVNGAKKMQQACSKWKGSTCNSVITGGNESGHAISRSHTGHLDGNKIDWRTVNQNGSKNDFLKFIEADSERADGVWGKLTPRTGAHGGPTYVYKPTGAICVHENKGGSVHPHLDCKF